MHHNVPGNGPVITDANDMSSKWRDRENIAVNGEKTVGGALGSSGNGYYSGGTCIGTYCNAQIHLGDHPIIEQIKKIAKKVGRKIKRLFK